MLVLSATNKGRKIEMEMKEDRVVDLMREWLPRHGYEVESYKHGNQPGDDVSAISRNGTSLYIECKGSIAEGKEFNTNAKFNCAASAFFNQVRRRETEPQSEVGIAFPNDEWYRKLMGKLEAFCKRNRIRIFWVSENSISEW
jgi:hypothetical protein